MSQDESKFDTMRLIAGAEASDLYSLEDIVREFTDSGAQPEETEQPEQPEQPEQWPAQPPVRVLPAQPTQLSPCFFLE